MLAFLLLLLAFAALMVSLFFRREALAAVAPELPCQLAVDATD